MQWSLKKIWHEKRRNNFIHPGISFREYVMCVYGNHAFAVLTSSTYVSFKLQNIQTAEIRSLNSYFRWIGINIRSPLGMDIHTHNMAYMTPRTTSSRNWRDGYSTQPPSLALEKHWALLGNEETQLTKLLKPIPCSTQNCTCPRVQCRVKCRRHVPFQWSQHREQSQRRMNTKKNLILNCGPSVGSDPKADDIPKCHRVSHEASRK